jgi:hypothetical protein
LETVAQPDGAVDEALREKYTNRTAPEVRPEGRRAGRNGASLAAMRSEASDSLLGSENCRIGTRRAAARSEAGIEHPKRERVRIRGQLRRADQITVSFFPVCFPGAFLTSPRRREGRIKGKRELRAG